jgi:hypothetical protein
MKHRAIAIILACAAIGAIAQTNATNWIYGYAGNRATWWVLGPSFVVSGNTIDVRPAPAPPVLPVRVIGEKLAYDTAAAGWRIPAGAVNVELYVNGLHYWQGPDYTVDAGVIKAISTNLMPEFDVRVSYER